VSFPFVEVFLALLVAYMAYSVWAGLDSRYPIAAALILLVVTAVVDALGNTGTANTLAEFVFFLLGAGVLLLLVDHVRESRAAPRPDTGGLAASPQSEPTESTNEGQGPAQETLHGLEEQPVSVVDAPGRKDDHNEKSGDAQPEPDEGQVGEGGLEQGEHHPDGEGRDEQGQEEVTAERMDAGE
jgi:hypothetical protein